MLVTNLIFVIMSSPLLNNRILNRYVPMKTCLHTIPSSIEQHGTEWPEEWPKRLETYPDWLNDKEKLSSDTRHWKAIFDRSYLTGLGIDWSKIRNVMDMKSIYGGYANLQLNILHFTLQVKLIFIH